MAPDKIYVAADSELGFKNTKTAIAFSFEQKFDTVGYIRKDVVMDMLLKEKEETSIGLNEWENGLENGRMEVANSLINKINAL